MMSTNNLELSTDSRKGAGRYSFPPGPEENVIVRGIRNRGPINPIAFFTELAQRFGDAAHYKLGRRHVVFLNSPSFGRDVFIAQHSSLIKERTQQRSKLLLGEGMITADGTSHRQQRQVAQPAFHRQRVAIHADEIVRRAAELRDQWRPGAEVDIYTEMMHLALGIVGKTLFSTELATEIPELNRQVNNVMDVYNAVVLLPAINFLLKIPFTPLRKFVHARERIDSTVYRMIAEHRSGNGDDYDLLNLMLASQREMNWTDKELRDQVVTTFLAGYETTAIALTWTWYLLAQHPEIAERLFGEIDSVIGQRSATYEDVAKLCYTEMVIAEALRLYPPAWAMGRLTTSDVEFGPWRIPPGTTVILSQYVLHRDPRYYPDPLRFDPERHTAKAKERRQRFSYIPFGMGPRQCIGEALAWMELILVVASVAQRWRLRLVPGQDVELQPLFTLRPKRGVRMIVEER